MGKQAHRTLRNPISMESHEVVILDKSDAPQADASRPTTNVTRNTSLLKPHAHQTEPKTTDFQAETLSPAMDSAKHVQKP